MKHYHVVGAIIEHDGKILCMQRPKGKFPSTDLKWEFPGGKIEAGETSEQALARESREELNTEIEVGERLCTVEHDYPAFHLSMQCFLCRVISGDFVLREHEAARWLGSDELWSVDWLPADIEVVKAIEQSGSLSEGAKHQ